MNIDITSALFTLILSILLPNSEYKDGASDEKVPWWIPFTLLGL